MERDALIAHGCSWFGKDRLMEQSDETRVWLCRICGLPALVIDEDYTNTISSSSSTYSMKTTKKECRVCETNDIVVVRMPYATKLLMQEFAGMNVIIRVLVNPHSTGNIPGTTTAFIYAGNKKIGECKVENIS